MRNDGRFVIGEVEQGGAALVLAAGAARHPPPVERRERAPLVLALSLCAAAGLVSAALSSEFVFTQRDPAIYAATARWLVDHASLDIETQGMTLLGQADLTKWEERLAEVPTQVYRYSRRTYLYRGARPSARPIPGQEEHTSSRP